MAGLWPQSLLFVPDANGNPIPGARAFFYEADTLTPRDAYQDYGLGVEHTWPVVANGRGIFPAVYLADGFFRIRITDEDGNVVPGYDLVTLPVIGPTQGGGGGGETPVDPNALLKTGDVIWAYRTGVRDGFVRVNGRTIGSGTSGATERANADVQALYEFLWNADASLEVTGGRGANATSDFEANKPLALPDWRGRSAFGLDDMGNSAAGRIDGGTTLGATGGAETHTLTVDEMPEHDHDGETGEAGDHTHGVWSNSNGNAPMNGYGYGHPNVGSMVGWVQGGDEYFTEVGDTGNDALSTEGAHIHSIAAQGGGEPHNNMPPYGLVTFYMKL